MKAILNKLNNYLPMKEFLNFFFITALGDYLQTKINISSLEKEISQKAVISLLGLKLNPSIINERHLSSSPMKLIEGTINKLEMSLTDDKISIHLSEMNILVMPLFNKNTLLMYQTNQQKTKINSDNSPASNKSQTLVESIINSMMQNVEISIDSICIKILTYEVFGNTLDNPTLSLFVSKISFKNKGDPEEEDFFLFNKEISLENFCIKIDQYYTPDETIFYNACKVQDEKLLFNFYCSNNTLCAINYNKGPGILIGIKRSNANINTKDKDKDKDKEDKSNDANKAQLIIDIVIQRIEIIANSTQIAQLLLFKTICDNIYSRNAYANNTNDSKESLANNSNSNQSQLKILGHIINPQCINITFEYINILINENITAKETPKLFSFYSKELQKSIKTIDEIETHFCYFEDNFFIVLIDTIKYSSFNSVSYSQSAFGINQIIFDYVEYQSKQPKKTSQLMSKKPSFMKMGSGSKLAVSQMQSCCGDSVYQSALSSNNSVYESVLDSELVLIENFNKLIAYDFFNSSFRICYVDKIEVKAYSNTTSTLHHSITNCSISSISIDFHFIFLFKAVKLLNANYYLSKELQKGSTQLKKSKDVQLKVKDNSNTTSDQPSILSDSNEQKSKVNQAIKTKSQLCISIKSFGLKLLNFKRDMSRIDTNLFFYEFFKENIQNYYMNKSSEFKYQMTQNTPVDSIKAKDYLLFKLSEIKILFVSKQKDSEIKVLFSQLILNYNYYTLVLFANAELPNIIIKGKKNEFVTELAAPLKSSATATNVLNIQEADLNALSNKNEMYFRNQIITIKSQYDYKNHTTTMRLSFNFTEDIHVNCEYLLIKQIMNYFDTLMFALNMVQIYQAYCGKISRALIEKIFALADIPKLEERMKKRENKTNLFITMDIDTLFIFINRNNTIGKEGNLIKVIVKKLTSNVAFKHDQTLNEAEIDIDNVQVFIQKNAKNKGDIRLSHTSLIKKMNVINQDDNNLAEYTLFLSKTGDSFSDSNKSMVSLHVYFNNEANIKEGTAIEKETIIDDNCYQIFLLENQLPMPDMTINSKISISNCYINLLWYDFDLKSNGLSYFIEEINSNDEEDYLPNGNISIKELIPLCQERKIDLAITIELQMMYIDLFFASNLIPKKEWMRMIVMLSYAKLKQKEESSEILFDQCRCFFLTDFDYNGEESVAEKDNSILNVIEDIPNETSYLKRIGFVELCYIQDFNLNKRSNRINDELQKINVVLAINAFELFLCKDSFMCLQEFILKANEYFKIILGHFSKDKLIIDDNESEKEEKDNEMEHNANNNIIINNAEIDKHLKDNKELRKEYHVIENYCFNTNKYDKQLEEIKEIEAEEDYENILDAQKKKRLRKKKSFDVKMGEDIEDDEKKEGDVQITGSINTIRVYLFKGRDFAFDFHSQLNKDNINYNETNFIEQSNSSISNNQQLIIEENYMKREGLNKNSLILLCQTRKKNKQRDYFNHICFYLSGFKGDISYYHESELLLSSSFSISKLTIEDKIKQSKYCKILSKYNYEDQLNFCSIKFEVNRSPKDQPNPNNEDVQLVIEAQLSPLNILIDQISLLFILQFFQIKLDLLNNNLLNNSSGVYSSNNTTNEEFKSSNCQIQINDNYLCAIGEFEQIDIKESKGKANREKEKPDDNSSNTIYIRNISIKEFKLNLSYNSHELSIQQLKRKNYLELLNISNITDFQVQFKGYERKEVKTMSDALSDLISFWRNDITRNQIVSAVLHSVAVVRPFVAIFDSVFDLIKQPVLSFRKDHSIKKGIGKGIRSFFSTFTTQSLFIGEKSFKTIQKMLGATRTNTLNKDSYYKKWMYKVNESKRKYDDHFLKK